MKAPIEAPQEEMPFASEVGKVLRTYLHSELLDMRDALLAQLRENEPQIAALLDRLAGLVPGQEGAAFTAAMCVVESRATRRRLRTLRTLGLYIAAREHRAAPHASALPPPRFLRLP